MAITLYHDLPSSNSDRVKIALAEKGLKWEGVRVRLANREQKTPRVIGGRGSAPDHVLTFRVNNEVIGLRAFNLDDFFAGVDSQILIEHEMNVVR